VFVQNLLNIPEINPEAYPATSDEINILHVMDLARAFEHVIGYGHVSGLRFAALYMPRAGMEMRG
jgi:sialic acid synthase SpsE